MLPARRRAALVLALLAFAVPVLLSGCLSAPTEGAMVGERAPEIAVETIDGGTWRLSEQRGKVVLIDLMGVNCPPCRAAMPALRATYERHDPAGFSMISIDMGAVFPGLGGDEHEMEAFRDEFRAEWAFAKDSDGRIGAAYRPIGLPMVVFVGPDGVVRKVMTGGVGTEEEFEIGIEKARADSPEGPFDLPILEGPTGGFGSTAILLAFSAGVLSFFAPCSVAMLPAYISYYLGRPMGRRSDQGETLAAAKVHGHQSYVLAFIFGAFGATLLAAGFTQVFDVGAGLAQLGVSQILLIALGTAFVLGAGLWLAPGRALQGGKLGLVVALGIFAVFLLVGLPVYGLLQLVSFRTQTYIVLGVAAVLIIMGVAGLFGKDLLSFTMPFSAPQRRDTASFFTFGVFYGLVALGCNLPLFLVAALGPLVQDADPLVTFFALVAYGSGMALLMVALSIGIAFSREAIQTRLTRWIPAVRVIGHLLLIGAGAYIVWYDLTVLRLQGV